VANRWECVRNSVPSAIGNGGEAHIIFLWLVTGLHQELQPGVCSFISSPGQHCFWKIVAA
jgi:hypothetical protein